MTALLILIFTPVVGQAEPGEPSQIDVLEKVRQHITPATHPLADRLPILTWQSRDFPTGLEEGRIAEVQQLLMDPFDAIYQRRAVKHYDPEHEFTDDEIKKLMEAAIHAPTSFNMQNLEFHLAG